MPPTLRLRCPKTIGLLIALLIASQCVLAAPTSGAEESIPLHERIDALIEAADVGPTAEIATDTDFLRRCYLDLVGRIPSLTETREFLQDTSPQKRGTLVDRLISHEEFNRFVAIAFDLILMERRPDNRITTSEWRKYLEESLAAKKPFDQLAREILAADGTDATQRPAAKFYLDRNVETHALTRDVSRMFFGRDVQCAQCHDHPLVDDYLQKEYYGLFSFLNRSFLFEDPKDNKKAYLGEKAEGEVEFASVFDPGAEKTVAEPELTDGLALDGEPRYDGGEAYLVKPDKDTRPVPKFSRREQLARLVTHTSSNAFARNITNRLWAHMMGQGIVDPVDFHHADNPPSHPELLAVLADEFVAMHYDVRAFLTQLALSKTYQRSIEFPTAAPDPAAAEAKIALLRQRIAEQEAAAEQLSHEVARFRQSLARERENLARTEDALAAAQKKIDDAGKAQQDADKQRSEVEQKLAEKMKAVQSVGTAATEAKKAADTLPDDKDLAAALKTLSQRAEAHKKESESLTAAVAKHKNDAEQAAAQVTAATREQTRLLSERTALADLVAEARGAHRAVKSRYLQATGQLEECQQQLAAAERVLYYSAKRSAESLAQAAVDSATVELNSLRDQLAAVQTKLTGLQAQLAAQQQTTEVAEQAAAAARTALADQQELLATLQEAAEKAQEAAARLNDNQQVIEAAAALSSGATELAARIDSAAGQSASQQAEADRAREALAQLELQLQQLAINRDETIQAVDEGQVQLSAAQQELETAQAATTAAYKRLSDSWTRRFVVKPLKPLSPEQMAGSVIRALDLDARFEREAAGEWTSKNKEKKPDEIDEAKKAAEIRELFEKRIKQVESTFVSLFAAAPASPQDVFSSTVDQALFLANDGRVRSWLQPSEGTLLKRLQEISEPDKLAAELYLSVLSRPPAADEVRETEQYLASRPDDRNMAIQELAWGLLTSLEFRFNH